MMNEPLLLQAHVYSSSPRSEIRPMTSEPNSTPDMNADLTYLPRLRISLLLLGFMVGAFTQLSDLSNHALQFLLPLVTQNTDLGQGSMTVFDALWSLLTSAVIVTFLILLRGLCAMSLKSIDPRKKLALKWLFEMDVWYGMGAVPGICLAFYVIHGAANIPMWLWFLGPFVSCIVFGGFMYMMERCVEYEEADNDADLYDSDLNSFKSRASKECYEYADYALLVV